MQGDGGEEHDLNLQKTTMATEIKMIKAMKT
jgi:hypothetical protein